MDKKIFMDPDALAFLARVTKALAKQPDLDRGISELMDEINQYFNTEAVSIFVLDKPKNELVLKYAAGPVSQEILGLRVPLGQGVVGWVAEFNDSLIVPAPGLDPRFLKNVDEQTGFITRSILCAPIVREGQIVGAIEVLNKTTGTFIDDDVTLLQELAGTLVDVCKDLWASA